MKKNNNEMMNAMCCNDKNHKNEKGMSTMTEKIYKAKGSATRAMKRAIEKGDMKAGSVEVRKTDEGFRIVNIETKSSKAKVTTTAKGLSEHQKSALTALAGVKALAEKNEDERAGVWFPFSEIYNSTKPADLSPRSMGGIMRALINRRFIQFLADGKEYIDKKAVAVCITDAGFAALSA